MKTPGTKRFLFFTGSSDPYDRSEPKINCDLVWRVYYWAWSRQPVANNAETQSMIFSFQPKIHIGILNLGSKMKERSDVISQNALLCIPTVVSIKTDHGKQIITLQENEVQIFLIKPLATESVWHIIQVWRMHRKQTSHSWSGTHFLDLNSKAEFISQSSINSQSETWTLLISVPCPSTMQTKWNHKACFIHFFELKNDH